MNSLLTIEVRSSGCWILDTGCVGVGIRDLTAAATATATVTSASSLGSWFLALGSWLLALGSWPFNYICRTGLLIAIIPYIDI